MSIAIAKNLMAEMKLLGMFTAFLAEHQDVQTKLRADHTLLPAAIEEIRRLESPLMSSRRVTTCRVQIGGRAMGARERVTLMWSAANRDPQAFEDPTQSRSLMMRRIICCTAPAYMSAQVHRLRACNCTC
jgi:hypothetical protein